MTQQEKRQLLLKDICARLPYGVNIQVKDWAVLDTELKIGHINRFQNYEIELRPYLRLMSSMTEEEFYNSPIYGNDVTHSYKIDKDGFHFIRIETYNNEVLDFLNAHHFDFRGLIEKGLAFEAPEGMYKIK